MELLLAVAGLSLLSGTLVGIMGVGGVILVPLLTTLLGLSLIDSMAAAACGFLSSGLAAVTVHGTHGRLPRRENLLLWTTAGAGALVGAALLVRMPAGIVGLFIGGAAIAAGVFSLVVSARRDSDVTVDKCSLAVLGTVTGIGSSLSATGGAVVLLPLLVMRGFGLRSAIAYAQSVQVPIALFATAYYANTGRLHVDLAAAISLGLVPGTALGAGVSRYLPIDKLRQAVSGVLIVMGAWYLGVSV